MTCFLANTQEVCSINFRLSAYVRHVNMGALVSYFPPVPVYVFIKTAKSTNAGRRSDVARRPVN